MKLRFAAMAIPLCLAAVTSASPSPAEGWAAEVLLLVDRSADCSRHFDELKIVAEEMLRRVDDKFPEGAVKFGLSTFIDKPFTPFGWFGDYPYKTHVPLTTDRNAVVTKMQSLDSYGGGDAKDSQLDALYYGGASKSVGWSTGDYDREDRQMLRFVVMLTNSRYHSNGEGKDEGLKDFAGGGKYKPDQTYPSEKDIHDVYDVLNINTIFLIADVTVDNYWGVRTAVSKTHKKKSDGKGFRPAPTEILEKDSANLIDRVDYAFAFVLTSIRQRVTPPATSSRSLPFTQTTEPLLPTSDQRAEILVLFDMSSQAERSWPNIKKFAVNMLHGLQDTFRSATVGLGTFRDKPTAPSALPDDYCYRTVLPLTHEVLSVSAALAWFTPKGGGNTANSQLDALYFGLKSPSVNWSSSGSRRRLVVMVTHGPYQTNLPGSSAAFPKGTTDETGCGNHDYASIDDVKEAFRSTGAVPIFLTPTSMKGTYQSVLLQLGRGGGVGSFDQDGSNFLEAVGSAVADAVLT